MTLAVGDQAPDFSLKSSDGSMVTLSSYVGKSPVVVMFYPFTFTAVCHGELCELKDNLARFASVGVQLLAVSCDAAPVQAKYAQEEGFGFPVLSDFWPHGAAAQAYGTFNDQLGCATRSTYVINKDGIITAIIATDSLGQARAFEEYEKAIVAL
jgi:peroxiredoxin